jgi:general secretion pathway protein A
VRAMSETYYGEFYGFRTAPFHVTPDASLLFPTETHQAALGAIEYGIKAGKGFVVVTGQVGVGKTTVLRSCLDRLESARTQLIYLYNPALTTLELYNTLLDELDPALRVSINPSDTLRALLRKLLETHQAGMQVILAVDEAQNMPDQTLESLRILSNLETTRTKLLQIILVGQTELDAKLRKHGLRQLRQRIAVRAHIRPLTFRQSCRYIQHRAAGAGRSAAQPLFTRPALWYLALAARGIPRTINICCDNALINGYGHAAPRIGLRIAREVCGSLGYRAPLWRAATVAATLVLLCCGVLFAGAWLPRLPGDGAARLAAHAARPAGDAPKPTPTSSPSATPAPLADTRPERAPAAAAAAFPADGGPPDMVSAAAGVVSAPADTAAAAGTGAAAHTAAPGAAARDGAGREAAGTRRQWVIRKGDSVYKVCLATYGYCDESTLQAVLADNPQLAAPAVVYPGDVLVLPDTIGALRARP